MLELSQAAKHIARSAEDAPPEIGPPPKLLLAWAAYGKGLENFSVRDTFKQLQAQAAQAKKEEAAREEELLRQQQEEKAARKGKLVLGKSRSVTPPQQKGHGVSASHSVPVLPH